MGKIISHGGSERYLSESGYMTMVEPKHNEQFDRVAKVWSPSKSYSLKHLQNVEKDYVKLNSFMDKEFAGMFIRSASGTIENNLFGRSIDFYLTSSINNASIPNIDTNWNLFSMHIQNGTVHNFPTAKFANAFNMPLVFTKKYKTTNQTNGIDTKGIIELLKIIKSTISKSFKAQGVEMTDEQLHTMLCVFKLYCTQAIALNVEGWVKYIVAGMTDMNVFMFGFNSEMFSYTNSYIPAEELEQYQGLPFEWVEKLYQS